MSFENNKMQVDIENLFKQNVNDLSAIKELYRKIKEVEDKISQIKYIDSALAKKLQKEYEKLKKIILDENIQTKLTIDIETINKKITNVIDTINVKLANDIGLINEKLNNDIESINSQLVTKASKEETNNIQQQVNNLVLGAVGDGNNAEVIQARGEYETLNSRLEVNFFNKWSKINPSWNDGYFINSKGQKAELTGYSVSNNISVENYKKIQLRNIKGNNQVSVLTFYSSTYEVLNTIVISSDEKFNEVEIPYNALSFVICKNNDNTKLRAYFNKEEINNDIIDLSDTITWTDGYYIDNTGAFKVSDSFKYSSLIKANKGINIKGMSKIENFPNIAFYSDDGSYVTGIKNINYYKLNDIDNPITHFRICINNKYNEPSIQLNIKNSYDDREKLINISECITLNDGYIDSNGDFKPPLAKFQYTNFLKVKKGIKIFNIVSNISFPNIAFYDKDFKFIRGINNLTTYEIQEIPDNAYYFSVATSSDKKLIVQVPSNYFFMETNLAANENCQINTPKYIDSVIDTETTIYMDNLLLSENSTFDIGFKYDLVDSGIQFTPTEKGELYLKIQERDDKYNLLNETNPIIRVVSSTDNNKELKNILIIGDSLIDNTYVAKETYRLLAESGATFNQLGTRGPADGKHEGHGGWSWEDYFKETYDSKPNAFYNKGELDFKNYCNVNGYSGIDFCIIAMGTNDVRQGNTTSTYFTDDYITSIIENAKKFINKLLADYPSCKIAIGLPSVGADLVTKNSKAFQYKMKKLLTAYIKTFDNGVYHQNVTTVANGLFINRRLGYQSTNKNVSKRFNNNSVDVITDYIHSNPNGYYCYSDCFYAKIRSWMAGNL